MMYRYRFYIGVTYVAPSDKFLEELGQHVDGYTIFQAKGCWKGVAEDSIVVEVLAHHLPAAFLARIAAVDYGQEAVIYTQESIEFNLIKGD